MTLALDAAALVAQVRAVGGPATLEERGVDGARAYLEANAARGAPGPPVGHVDECIAAGVPVRIYRPATAGVLPVVTYFHGGGWVLGSIPGSDAFCRRLAVSTPCVVVSVGYRLAPDAPWPAAVDDGAAVVAWVGAHAAELGGGRNVRHIVLGDSAGGNITAVAVRRVLCAGTAPVDRQVLAYPIVGTTQDRRSHVERGQAWPLLSSDLAWFVRLYVPDEANRRDPDVSLLDGDVRGAPSTTLLLAGCDPLRDEGLAYAQHLAASGVPVVVHEFKGQIHGFLTFPEETLPTSREALGVVANAIRCA
jgi:acetyl esterase